MNDIGKADPKKLKALGAAGVLVVGDNMQAIFGTRSENLKTDIEEYLKVAGDEAELSTTRSPRSSTRRRVWTRYSCATRWPPKGPGLHRRSRRSDNIVKVDAAAETRLRVKVKNADAVDENALTAAGIAGFVDVGGGRLHLLAGPNADQYAGEIRGQLAAAPALAGR